MADSASCHSSCADLTLGGTQTQQKKFPLLSNSANLRIFLLLASPLCVRVFCVKCINALKARIVCYEWRPSGVGRTLARLRPKKIPRRRLLCTNTSTKLEKEKKRGVRKWGVANWWISRGHEVNKMVYPTYQPRVAKLRLRNYKFSGRASVSPSFLCSSKVRSGASRMTSKHQHCDPP